jgi:hypothetical protein
MAHFVTPLVCLCLKKKRLKTRSTPQFDSRLGRPRLCPSMMRATDEQRQNEHRGLWVGGRRMSPAVVLPSDMLPTGPAKTSRQTHRCWRKHNYPDCREWIGTKNVLVLVVAVESREAREQGGWRDHEGAGSATAGQTRLARQPESIHCCYACAPLRQSHSVVEDLRSIDVKSPTNGGLASTFYGASPTDRKQPTDRPTRSRVEVTVGTRFTRG